MEKDFEGSNEKIKRYEPGPGAQYIFSNLVTFSQNLLTSTKTFLTRARDIDLCAIYVQSIWKDIESCSDLSDECSFFSVFKKP